MSAEKTDIRVRELFPGAWEDGNGAVHFDVGEIHALFDLPDTPETREETTIMLQNTLAKMLPGVKMAVRGDLN